VLVVGEETHGRLLGDKDIAEWGDFVTSEEGERVQRLLWEETVGEMRGMVEIPSWMG
jgi:hypothetical protein